jgi:hypothetical protein
VCSKLMLCQGSWVNVLLGGWLVAESEEGWWLWSLVKVLLGGWLIAESEDDW